jgi:sugar phosphate isomerase/epimerase
MMPCISEATTLPASFLEDLDAYASAGCRAMEVWLTKLETSLAEHSAAELRKRIEDKQIALAAASYQGGLLLSLGAQRKAHFDHFKRRLEICQLFGIRVLTVVADFVQGIEVAELERAVDSLRQAAQWAAGFDVRLALEFRGAETFCASLPTALLLTEHCGEPNVGVCFDVFQFYKGPSKLEDIERLRPESLALVQVCDVAGVPRELMADSDRVLPGDGDFQLVPILKRIREIGYDGCVSLELMNPALWQNKPAQVVGLGVMSMDRLLKAVAP